MPFREARTYCAAGNPRPELGPNFFEPTVISGVDSSMKLFQEETFGPILAIQIVRDAQEAIAQAIRFTLCACGEYLDKRQISWGWRSLQNSAPAAVMVNDAISYFGIARSSSRRLRRERVGPHARAGGTPRNGANEIY